MGHLRVLRDFTDVAQKKFLGAKTPKFAIFDLSEVFRSFTLKVIDLSFPPNIFPFGDPSNP